LDQLGGTFSAEIGSATSTPSLLREVPEFSASSSLETTASGTANEIAPGIVAAQGEATIVTTETKSLLSLGSAGTFIAKGLASPVTGGAITVAGNAYGNGYQGLNAEQTAVAGAVDFVAGTVIAGISDLIGIGAGVLATPVSSPVGGVAVGVIAASGSNYLLSAGYSAVRSDVIGTVYSGVNTLNSFGEWVGGKVFEITH
jgi:hypothetical protein